MQPLRDLGQDMLFRGVGDGVRRVEPEAVDVKFRPPVNGVLDKKIPHRLELEIESVAPGRLVRRVEIIAAVTAEIIPVRPEMVVDHVENHRQAAPVRGVDQRPQVVRRAVNPRRRVEQHPVVTPVSFPGKIRHRHDLDRAHPERDEMIQLLDRAAKSARRGKRADVQFVNDQLGQRRRDPAFVRPGVVARIDHLGRPVHALGIETRSRIGPLVSIEAVFVAIARAPFRDRSHSDTRPALRLTRSRAAPPRPRSSPRPPPVSPAPRCDSAPRLPAGGRRLGNEERDSFALSHETQCHPETATTLAPAVGKEEHCYP